MCLLIMPLWPLWRPLQTLILPDGRRGTAGAIPKICAAVHRRIGGLTCSRVGTTCLPYSCRLPICLSSLCISQEINWLFVRRMFPTLGKGQRVALSGRNHGVRPLWLIEESATILVRCSDSALSSPSRLDIGRLRTLREEGNHDACYGFDRACAQGM